MIERKVATYGTPSTVNVNTKGTSWLRAAARVWIESAEEQALLVEARFSGSTTLILCRKAFSYEPSAP